MVVFFMTERGVGVVLAAAVSSRCFPAIVIQGKQVVGVFSPDACLIVKEGIIDLGLQTGSALLHTARFLFLQEVLPRLA